MKLLPRVPTVLILSLAICAMSAVAQGPDKPPKTIAVSCLTAVYPGTTNCQVGGQVRIDGTGYGHNVLVSLIDPDGVEFYRFRHITEEGVLISINGLGTTEGVWTARTVKGNNEIAVDLFEVGPEVVVED